MPAPLFDANRQRLLEQAIALSRRLSEGTPKQQLRWEQQLHGLWQALQPFQHQLTESPRPGEQIPAQVRCAMAEALVLLPLYQGLIAPGAFYGSLRSPTLESYQPLSVPEAWQQHLTTARLAEVFGLSLEEQGAMAQRRAQAVARVERHRQLFQALRQRFDGLVTHADAMRLFQQLFGAVPVPSQAVQHVGTEFQIVFALDYGRDEQGHLQLQADCWGEMATDDQETARAFLERIEQFSFQQFSRFPSFGHVEPQGITIELIEQLSNDTGLSEAEVQRILSQSVGIVPAAKAESFLIHDVWGHLWQLLLTSFEGDYALLARADQELAPGLAAYTPEGPLSLRQLFKRDGDEVSLDRSLAQQFFHGEAQQRLGYLLTHLVAELLADVQEFQWLWQYPERAEWLPSSSLFKGLPAKLDLTLRDVEFFFPQILEPLLSLTVSPTQASSLEQSLLQEWGAFDGGTRGSVKGAIAQLQSVFWQEYLATYAPEAASRGGWFSDFLGNLLQLQHCINGLYTSASAQQEPSFQAVMVLFVGVYCSGDCYQDFWNLDDDLAQWLVPAWQLWLDRMEERGGTEVVEASRPDLTAV